MTEGQVQALLNEAEKMNNTLERIEGAFCGINESLEALSQCVDFVPPNRYQVAGYNFFRIGGSVDNGNY
ncbi:MAG: hypothetical protein HFH13_06250 [Dorea sp.]|jgi:hypothetical protein|nr:hypothetical protein [Dorea sp.]